MKLNNNQEKPVLVFKYGGNAMTDKSLKIKVLEKIAQAKRNGYRVVIAHGGGPFIKKILSEVRIESEFIDGQRKTTPEAFEYVEMALKGKVNSEIVNLLCTAGHKAVGLSGKDANTVTAVRRMHKTIVDGNELTVNLGQVGDVKEVNPQLIELLLQNDFIPVIACVAADECGESYNINGDMFAGHIAGSLKASQYIVLTDVDGLLRDKNDADSLIRELELHELNSLVKEKVIQGGMIPKIESCAVALANGALAARIINGTVPEQIEEVIAPKSACKTGTLIRKRVKNA